MLRDIASPGGIGVSLAISGPDSGSPFRMFRFMVLFVILLGGLFVVELLQPVDRHVILPFTSGIAHVCVWLVGLFDPNVTT
ncbi:MAG: hypothetical protein ACRETD_13700, partial [Steroidobacteraceae bacterium]